MTSPTTFTTSHAEGLARSQVLCYTAYGDDATPPCRCGFDEGLRRYMREITFKYKTGGFPPKRRQTRELDDGLAWKDKSSYILDTSHS